MNTNNIPGENTTGMTRAQINSIIMNYLITEGYQEAAEHFEAEANIEPSETENTSMLHERMEVREAIQNGDIQSAVQLLDSHFSGLLLSQNELRFQLQLQHFVELIRNRQCETALEYAQRHLAAAMQAEDKDEAMLDRLERAMALLAFDDPTQSPFSDLLLESQRHKLASEVNAAILSSCDQQPTSKLATFYQLLLWMQSELDRQKVSYERLVDLASAATETANSS